jgi:ketosteroid isomerase-like protein
MTENSLEVVFRTQMAGYAACDVEQLMTSFAVDATLTDMADTQHPFVGRDEIRAFLVDYFASLANVDVTITGVAETGDLVIGELDVTADWVGAPHSLDHPRPVRFRYAVAETIRDGLVVEERFYWDSADLDRQITG